MSITHEQIEDFASVLGESLTRPASLCLIGSAAMMMLAPNTARAAEDIDIWVAGSQRDRSDLERALRGLNVFELWPDSADPQGVVQFVGSRVFALPEELDQQVVGNWGNLALTTPSPAMLAASKLVRCSAQDMEDAIWLMNECGIHPEEVRAAARRFPPYEAETASENVVLLEIVAARGFDPVPTDDAEDAPEALLRVG